MSCLRRKKVISGENDLCDGLSAVGGAVGRGEKRQPDAGGRIPKLQPARLVEVRKGTRLLRCDRAPGAERQRCPYCTNRKVLAGFNDLATLEPAVAKEWHPTLNGALTPEMVTAGEPPKGLVAMCSRSCLEGGHLSPYRQAALRLSRLRRQNENKTK